MNLKLQRIFFKETYTIGKLYLNDVFFCETLEDKYRDLSKEVKVYRKTCIPFGTYKFILSQSNRFKMILPELLNVPFFEKIRIHAGNTDANTEGCILVGDNKIKGGLINSRDTLANLMPYLDHKTNLISIIQKV